MSRPIKQPSRTQLHTFTPVALFAKDAVAILKKCHAPREWGNEQALLIAHWLANPACLIPFSPNSPGWKKVQSRPGGKQRADCWRAEGVARALAFARMFAEAPDAMIAALPKIQKRIKTRLANPQFNLLFQATIENEVNRIMRKKRSIGIMTGVAKEHGGAKLVSHVRAAVSGWGFPKNTSGN